MTCCMLSGTLNFKPATHWRATKSTVLATKSTELVTMSTATSCRIQVVADLSPVSATVDFVTSVYQALISHSLDDIARVWA